MSFPFIFKKQYPPAHERSTRITFYDCNFTHDWKEFKWGEKYAALVVDFTEDTITVGKAETVMPRGYYWYRVFNREEDRICYVNEGMVHFFSQVSQDLLCDYVQKYIVFGEKVEKNAEL